MRSGLTALIGLVAMLPPFRCIAGAAADLSESSMIVPSMAPRDSLDAGPLDLGLIDVRELGRDSGRWTILDARPPEAFRAGHVPGARSFSWEDYTKTDEVGVPFKAWPPGELARALGAMGIDENAPIVVYGDADKSWGGEGWVCWSLAWIGHRGPVRLMTGGIQAWRRAGFTLQAGASTPPLGEARYQSRLRRELLIETAELRNDPASVYIVDTRSRKEWILGHLPGAVHIPWDDFYSGEDRRPISPETMRELLRTKGVGNDRPVAYYCAGGIRSSYAWLIHQLSGLPPARNYEGGMEEWKRSN